MLSAAVMEKLVIGGGGFLIATILAVAAYFIKEFLGEGKTKVAAATTDVKALTKELHDFKVAVANAVNGVRAELQAFDRKWSEQHIKDGVKMDNIARDVAIYSKDVSKLEGKLEQHMDLLSNQISMNRAINDKFVKIFEYVEAKERATDAPKKKAQPAG